jgi:hypothetical protein
MTPKQRRNFYVHPAIPLPARFGLGFNKLIEESQRLNVNTAWIICLQKGYLKEDPIASVIGQPQAKALHDGKIAVKCQNVEVIGHYATKMPSIGDGFPILTLNFTEDRLNQADELVSVPSMIVVPFAQSLEADGETKAWQEKRSPEIIRA